MKLLTKLLLGAGAYYLYKKNQKPKRKHISLRTPAEVDYLTADKGESLYIEGGGMYLNTTLPGDVIVEIDDPIYAPAATNGLGACCDNCAAGLPCSG